ncbi:F5/8 type C domain-containing protein [Microbacterium sp. SLBN-146]|nr:F5/8 type C domain-containing protein [Microbacterium sp. SLBN-146]
MKSRKAKILAAVTTTALLAGALAGAPQAAVAAGTPVTITPNPAYASDPFEGWGTSLVWFANATGGYPEDVREDLFQKVFGEDGLNLNIARYNIGGGNATDVPSYLRPGGAVDGWWAAELGESDAEGPITSTYADRDRYAAAWDGENPEHYDFSADETQRWWIDALADKITKWEAFSNSPPYFLTESGFVSGGIDSATSEQLATEDMDAFASYLVNVVEYLEETHGIEFETLDPFNEPNTNYWSTRIGEDGWPTTASRQEGAHIGPARQDAMIKALQARLETATTDVEISAMDETNPGTFVTNWNGWSTEAKNAVSQLNVHTYGTSGRVAVRDIAKSADKPLWMSEIEGNWDTSGVGFNQTNIDNGLGIASRITDDLRELEPTAWVLWQPVEDLYNMEKVERLNWGSVFIDFDCDADGNSLRRLADGDADPSCKVLTNAKYNTIRNYTHYIHPGDRLIQTDNTQTTAAISSDADDVTLVHINTDTTARDLTIDLSKFGSIAPGATVTPIITTESPAADPTANALVAGTPVPVDAARGQAVVSVPAKSVATLVISGVSEVSDDAPALRDGHSYQLFGVQSGLALAADPSTLVIRTGATTPATAVAQTWTVRTIDGEGTNRHRFALQAGDGRLLGVAGGDAVLSSAAVEAAASDPSLQWIASTGDGKTYSLLSVADQRVLDVNGQSTANGSRVGLWTTSDADNQRWTLADTGITSVSPVSTTTPTGVAATLPGQVTLNYRGGVERRAAVQWDASGVDWSTAGTKTVTGTGTDLFGAEFEAVVTVEVGSYRATEPTSLTTYAGVDLDRVVSDAPTTVTVRVGDAASELPVEWDWAGLSDASFASTGVVRVTGTATTSDPANPTLGASLAVILTTPGEANVAPASTATASFTESSSYSVDRTKNGITSDKGWSNWRSGTKNATDTLTYALAERERVEHVKIHFYKDGSSTSWAQTLTVETRTGTGAWTPTGIVTVPTPGNGTAPVVDVPLAGVQADQVRVVLTAYPATHMIVSEVEIYAAAAGTADVADLAALTLDGAGLEGFTPDRAEYEASWAGVALPVVRAVPVDRNASVSIAQASEADPVATVTVTAPGGATRTYTVTFSREEPPLLEATVASSIRCIAGKAYVTMTLTNTSDVPVDITATTPYGTKSFSDLAPGKRVSVALNSRMASIPAGEIGLALTGVVDGAEVERSLVAPLPAGGCAS